jgi:iron complex transport system ATP-binding protein
MNNDYIIELTNLQLGFKNGRKTKLLGQPFGVQAAKGQLIALIGSNGAGKSTLIKTICNLHPAVSGTIIINNQPLNNLNRLELARLVSLVSTDLERTTKLRVYDLVALGRFPHNNWLGTISSEDHKIIVQAIKDVGMENFMDNDGLTLSDGEYQRVMIARALAQDTPIIMLDEPTAFLDLANRYHIISLLNQLAHDQQKTILFSTHDLAIAMQHADQLWVMTPESFYAGISEDLLLKGVFDHLFRDKKMMFDLESMQYKQQKKQKASIAISGENQLVAVTKSAMERIGFKVVSNKPADVAVYVFGNKEQICWEIETKTGKQTVNSVEALLHYFKMNSKL